MDIKWHVTMHNSVYHLKLVFRMWFIFFMAGLAAASATGLYTPICSDNGPPVCATNGQSYIYFQNECKLNAYIYKQLFSGRLIPVKTDIENCLPNCDEIVCPTLFKPVCAQQVPTATVKTVANACLVDRLICETKQRWTIIGDGPCSPFQGSKSQAHPEYTFISVAQKTPSHHASASATYSAPTSSTNADQNEGYSVEDPDYKTYSDSKHELTSTDIAQLYEGAELVPVPAPSSASAQELTAVPLSKVEKNQSYLPPTSVSQTNEVIYQHPKPFSAVAATNKTKTDSSKPYIVSEQTLRSILASYIGENQVYVAEDPVSVSYVDPEPSLVPQKSSYPVQVQDNASQHTASATYAARSSTPDTCAIPAQSTPSQDQVYASPETDSTSQPSYAVQDQVYASPASYSAAYDAQEGSTATHPSSYTVDSELASDSPPYVIPKPSPTPQKDVIYASPASYSAPSPYAVQDQLNDEPPSVPLPYGAPSPANPALQPSPYPVQDQIHVAPASASYVASKPCSVPQSSPYPALEKSSAEEPSTYVVQDKVSASIAPSSASNGVPESIPASQSSRYATQDQYYNETNSSSASYAAPDSVPVPLPSSYVAQDQIYASPAPYSAAYEVPESGTAPQPSSYSEPVPNPMEQPPKYEIQDPLYALPAPASVTDVAPEPCPAPQPSLYSAQDPSYATPALLASYSGDQSPTPALSSYEVPAESCNENSPTSSSQNTESVSSPYSNLAPSTYEVSSSAKVALLASAPATSGSYDSAGYQSQSSESATDSCRAPYPEDQSPTAASYTMSSPSYRPTEVVPSSLDKSARRNTETMPSLYSNSGPSSYVTAPAAVTPVASSSTSYQTQSSVSASESYGAPALSVDGYPAASVTQYSAPIIAPNTAFPPWLNSKTNVFTELEVASNIAKLVRGHHSPFGPIYYQPNYVRIIYYDD